MANAKQAAGVALPTSAELLRRRLHAIEARMLELLDCSTVETPAFSGVDGRR